MKKKVPVKNIFIASRDAAFNMKEDEKPKVLPTYYNPKDLPVFDNKTINILID